MASHKHREHLEKIKDVVINSKDLNEKEKSNTIAKIQEWLAEDKASGVFIEELMKISSKIKPILAEVGLI